MRISLLHVHAIPVQLGCWPNLFGAFFPGSKYNSPTVLTHFKHATAKEMYTQWSQVQYPHLSTVSKTLRKVFMHFVYVSTGTLCTTQLWQLATQRCYSSVRTLDWSIVYSSWVMWPGVNNTRYTYVKTALCLTLTEPKLYIQIQITVRFTAGKGHKCNKNYTYIWPIQFPKFGACMHSLQIVLQLLSKFMQ